jgi:hypothetical protein
MTRVGWGTINVVRSAQQNESHSASYTMSCVSDQSDAVRAMRPAKLECPTCRFAARRKSGELAMAIGSLVTIVSSHTVS